VLRPAEGRDRDLVRGWRNHPDVRAMSLTQHEITPSEHAAWWDRATVDPTRRVLVYDRRGTPSGSVTFFDIVAAATSAGGTERSAWWGYFLDVVGLQERGELLPAWIEVVREGTRYAVEELGLDVLHGEVLERNEAVRSLNRRFGIREVGSERRDLGGTTETVLRLELRAGDVRSRAAARSAGGPSA